MSDIFPAEGQSVSDVIADLSKLGLVDGTDFRTHWTWDMRPYVKAEPDAYKKWQAKHGADDAPDKEAGSSDATAENDGDKAETQTTDDDKDTKSNSESGDEKGNTSRKRGGK